MEKNLKVMTERFMTIADMFGLQQEKIVIAGPCAIENEHQMEQVAKHLLKHDVRFIRGGGFKPRTSPYSFQGLGRNGLDILSKLREKYKLITVSEIMDPRDVGYAMERIDIIQIGSRNMSNFSLLKEVGESKHPVILKRGMMSTFEEFLLAAEYIIQAGNKRVILCERGIRTFDNSTRNTLDISCIALAKQYTSLPVIVDLSHSLGRTDIIGAVKRAVEQLCDGIMVEVHPNPQNAMSDVSQQLSFEQFTALLSS